MGENPVLLTQGNHSLLLPVQGQHGTEMEPLLLLKLDQWIEINSRITFQKCRDMFLVLKLEHLFANLFVLGSTRWWLKTAKEGGIPFPGKVACLSYWVWELTPFDLQRSLIVFFLLLRTLQNLCIFPDRMYASSVGIYWVCLHVCLTAQ